MSRDQDDLRNSSEALRITLRFDRKTYTKFCEVPLSRYNRWETGALDLREEELTRIRLSMFALASQQKAICDKCMVFVRRQVGTHIELPTGAIATIAMGEA